MGNRINFTKRALEAISPAPAGKRAYYYDTKIRGLVLDVTPNGVKTFRLYRKVNGQPQRSLIGRFPDVSVERARAKAEADNGKIANGENPGAKRRDLRKEMKFGEMFDLYLERYAKKEKRSWSGDEWLYKRYLAGWANRPLSSLDRDDVERLHTAIGNEHGTYAANRALSLVSALYNKALEWGWPGTKNPAKAVKRFEEERRERYLYGHELPRFFGAVQKELDTDARDAILLMLFTGARKMNVLSMRWQDVGLERAVWRIPLTKSGKHQNVALVPIAIRVLTSRPEKAKGSEYVFPGRRGNGHRMEIREAWDRIRAAANLGDVRLHDLRRTLGSWQAASGSSLLVIGKSLGHLNQSTTEIYAHLDLDPVRQSVTAATQAMLTAGGLDP
ncbi:MAG: site-specific integrase [Gemmatimonadales bacterium]